MKLRVMTFLSLVYITQLGAAEVVEPQDNLIKSIKANDPSAVCNIIAEGASDKDLGRILHWAVIHDADHVLEAFMKCGWDIDARDITNHTPLYYAIFDPFSFKYRKNVFGDAGRRIITMLIQNGATVDGTPVNRFKIQGLIKKIDDTNPVIKAHQLEILSELLNAGAPVDSRDDDLNTPLHEAAAFNQVEAIDELVKLKADLNARDRNGDTPLHKAIFFNSKQALIRLLELGAEANEKNNAGQTPRELALSLGKNDLAQTTGL